MWEMSHLFKGQNVSIKVPKEAISELHKRIPVLRKEAFHFIEEDFTKVSSEVWQSLGCPTIDLESVWTVFSQMGSLLHAQLNSVY